jgi:hypothetical protein
MHEQMVHLLQGKRGETEEISQKENVVSPLVQAPEKVAMRQ